MTSDGIHPVCMLRVEHVLSHKFPWLTDIHIETVLKCFRRKKHWKSKPRKEHASEHVAQSSNSTSAVCRPEAFLGGMCHVVWPFRGSKKNITLLPSWSVRSEFKPLKVAGPVISQGLWTLSGIGGEGRVWGRFRSAQAFWTHEWHGMDGLFGCDFGCEFG